MTPTPIPTVHKLVQELLRDRDGASFGTILQRYEKPSRDLEPYCNWNERHYTRTCIYRNDQFELLVVCFEIGQCTSIHDYDSQTAFIKPVLGEVVEERFIQLPNGSLARTAELHRPAGQMVQFTANDPIHRFINYGPGRAITLNLYTKPMSRWRIYDERTGHSYFAPVGPVT